jgi:DNA-binding CsgD family transcriptional regulator
VATEINADRAVLYGREHEMEVLAAILANGTERGDARVIRGDPGVGKSALLDVASAMARTWGYRVLTATGVQSEAELPFAGLHQLLRPLPWTAEALPAPQQEAVLAAFGRSRESVPDPFLIALATLDLLADATAARSPLLVVADDAQWLDRPTASALTFVARRVQWDPIVMLFAVRDGSGRAPFEGGLNEMRVAPLDDAAAAGLLDARAPGLAASRREQILDLARGNPLALVELPVQQHDPSSSASPMPEGLQLTARLESAFSARFFDLPELTRAVLLVAALHDGSDLAEVLSAVSSLRNEVATPSAVAPAEAARLVDVTNGQVLFHHPLIRSAIQRGATLSNRMAAHAALADALRYEPERRAWHRASAVIGRDETVAADLDRVAETVRARGARVVAVSALRRSAELTPDPARRLDRLLRAAEAAFEVGRRDTVGEIVEQAEPLMPLAEGPLERGRLALVHGLREAGVLPPERLRSLVAIARHTRGAGDANLAWNLLWRLAQRCFWADPGPEARQIVVSAAEVNTDVEAADARQVAVLAYAAPLERANAVIDQITHWPLERAGADDARLLGSAGVVVGAFDLSVPFLNAAVFGLRKQGRLAHLARALTMQGWTALCLADWRLAIPALDEAVRMATETGETAWAAGAMAMQAIIAAMRGQIDDASGLSMAAEASASATGATHMLAYTRVARGFAALGGGRPDDAYRELLHIYDPDDPAYHRVPGCRYVGELAEAAALSGQVEEARARIQQLEPSVQGSRSPWILSAFSYARAVLADDASFEQRVREALARGQVGRWPFQRARLQLSYGTWLRRQRRVADARIPLRSARDAFDAISTPAWAERARQELRAAGETSQGRRAEVWDQLSPQELQIASMAAEGLSNREIAQRLYLSPRTVGSHLYRVFPKLGITSRAQLGSALARP